jgi:hypothetical protein
MEERDEGSNGGDGSRVEEARVAAGGGVTVDNRRTGGVSPTVWAQWYDGTEVNVAHGAMASAGVYVIDFA